MMEKLNKAVSHFLVASEMEKVGNKAPFVSIMGPSVDDVEMVLEAARSLLNAPERWWCEAHVANGCTHFGADHCKETHYSKLSHAFDDECRMVRVRLVEVTE